MMLKRVDRNGNIFPPMAGTLKSAGASTIPAEISYTVKSFGDLPGTTVKRVHGDVFTINEAGQPRVSIALFVNIKTHDNVFDSSFDDLAGSHSTMASAISIRLEGKTDRFYHISLLSFIDAADELLAAKITAEVEKLNKVAGIVYGAKEKGKFQDAGENAPKIELIEIREKGDENR